MLNVDVRKIDYDWSQNMKLMGSNDAIEEFLHLLNANLHSVGFNMGKSVYFSLLYVYLNQIKQKGIIK